LAVRLAAKANPDLVTHRISPHTIRHYLPFLTMSCDAAIS